MTERCAVCGKPVPVVHLFCPWPAGGGDCPARACSPECLAKHEQGHIAAVVGAPAR